MDCAVIRRCVSLAAGLLLAVVTSSVAIASSVTMPSGAPVLPEGQDTLASFRQSVWLVYAASAAMGPDARGHTIAQDIATWVLPDVVRRPLGEVTPAKEAASLEEPRRLLTLVGFYWARQVTLRHERALWLQALERAPASEVESSHTRIDALENRLQRDFAPAMTLDALTGALNELMLAYDSERQRAVGFGGEVHGAVFERTNDLPCTRMVAPESQTSANHGLKLLWSPVVMDFYPATARRDNLTGRVLLQVQADDTGCQQHIEVVRSSGAPELDAAALDIAARTQFAPAVRDGKPVETTVRLPIVFKLDGMPPVDVKTLTQDPVPAPPPPSAPPFSLAAKTPAEHIQSGKELLDHENYDQAIGEFDLAIATDPAAVMAYADRGFAHLGMYEIDLARNDFENALRLASDNAAALRGRGVLEYQSGDCAAARADLTRSIELDTRSVFALRWRAEVDSCLSQDAQALADLATAEKVDPQGFSLYSDRALVLRALGRPNEALAEIDTMLAVSNDSSAHLIAGAIYADTGKAAAAAAELDLGVSLAPTERAYLVRARLRPHADLRAQREDYSAALTVNPKSHAALLGLIKVSALEGDDSSEVLNAAVASHLDDTLGLLGRGIDQWRRGERSAADQDLRAAIEHAGNRDFNDVCYSLAVVNIAVDRALDACNRAVKLMPHLSSFLDSRALVYLRLGKLKEALVDYDLALQCRPHFAAALYGRGLVRARLGQTGAGAKDRTDALRLDATIADFFHTIGLNR